MCAILPMESWQRSSLPPGRQNPTVTRQILPRKMVTCFPHLSLFPREVPRLHPCPIPARHMSPRATSMSTSGTADFPEQMAGDTVRQRRRRRRVAGIDQDELVDPTELAEPDSVFCEFNGVKIHHKICHHEEDEQVNSNEMSMAKIGLPMILLHGFGASVFSWNPVMKPLARFLGARVLAFDRPAFGFTSRVVEERMMDSNPYSMAFSVMATISFIDMLGVGKAILMGHSAGCLVAVNTYFEAPEKVAALILVAPAIVAPLVLNKRKEINEGVEDKQMKDRGTKIGTLANPLNTILEGLHKLYKFIAGLILQILNGIKYIVGLLFRKALTAILRSAFALMLVRLVMDRFGILAIRNAWYDASQVTDHVLTGYTKPLKAKGWEKALLEYTIALLADSSSKSLPPLTKRLSEISCPVLIVTGDTDRLVPSWNAERLSRTIPNSTLEVIKRCGHLPHEERVEEFLSIVEGFLQRTLGSQEGHFSQAAA